MVLHELQQKPKQLKEEEVEEEWYWNIQLNNNRLSEWMHIHTISNTLHGQFSKSIYRWVVNHIKHIYIRLVEGVNDDLVSCVVLVIIILAFCNSIRTTISLM